ncbi:MAG: WG repeat-containing protein [Zoogloeaceae bacterium]|nr:WG repeat-containing protein [Zoogloeaceae bacterium]
MPLDLPALSRKSMLLAVLPLSIYMAACQDDAANAPTAADTPASAPAPADVPALVSPLAIPVWVNGRHAVVDGGGKLRIPFENEYHLLLPVDYRDTVFAASDEGWSLISADGEKVIKANISNTIGNLTPGIFWFEEKGKYGVIDTQGNVIQPPRYDEIYFLDDDRKFILYAIGGKSGLMNAKGEPVTEAVYDEIASESSYAGYGGLIMAKRDSENWLIDSRSGAQEKVPYNKIRAGSENDIYRIATDEHGKQGIIDANGKLVIAVKYAELGQVSEGLVSFREDYGSPCGYLDVEGKVILAAKYSKCTPFGKKGALVQEEGNAQTGEAGQYGLLDRQGAWVVAPKYAEAYDAGVGSGWGQYVPGITAISVGDIFNYKHGLFDTDKGVEILTPEYALVSVLTDKILGFATAESPRVSVSEFDSLPAIGLMDYAGKVLLPPERFTMIRLDSSEKFLIAVTQGKQALIGLDGKEIIAPEWQKLETNTALGLILAYETRLDSGGDSVDILRAAYDFNGKPLFAVRTNPCGAEILLDGGGKTLWPQDATPYCTQ